VTIGRVIDLALVEHLGEAGTTTCRLLRIAPVGIAAFGITTLDRDVPFDDGDGLIVYRARRGYTPSAQVGSSDLSVENSEAEALLAEFPLDGVTMEQIRRGVHDDAHFVEYLVNYQATDYGKAILGSGTIGELRADKELRVFIERRSLTQTLKQKSIIEVGSVSCRDPFGGPRCKYPVETLWSSGVVLDVGFEADRTFSFDAAQTSSFSASYSYVPGLVYFRTGANAGRTYEIESADVDSSGLMTVSLAHPTEEPIADTDEFDIRPDCDKWWGPNGTDLGGTKNNCLYWNNRLNFQGEPFRPVADSASMAIPGGGGGGLSGIGGTQTTSPEEDA
jgi:uncharacterized phage protein (TIGR02218 family)